MDRRLEILDLPDDARELVRDCEITGRRTLFTRNGREVAILVSHDEYLALRETIEIAGDGALRGMVERGEEEVARGQLLLLEDLLETMNGER
jgi:PHD/YefM family antitoxin component YafN of YafNO toxin-antitoxin module